MRERIQKTKDTLDLLVLFGYYEIKPTIDKISGYLENMGILIRHPIAVYILYQQEKALRYMDPWERMDYELRQERNQQEYLF